MVKSMVAMRWAPNDEAAVRPANTVSSQVVNGFGARNPVACEEF